MKPFRCVGFLLALCAVANLASANTMSSIPSYYDQLQFNLTSPSAYSTAIGGYQNPAVYGTLPGSEIIYSWSDKGNSFSDLGDWGLFLGGSHLGLPSRTSAQRERKQPSIPPDCPKVGAEPTASDTS